MTEILLAYVAGGLSATWGLCFVQLVRTTKREDD